MYDPTSLVRRIISSRHTKLELPCMNDPISRELNQKIRRFKLHFQHADQSNYKSTITRSGDSKNVPLVPNKTSTSPSETVNIHSCTDTLLS